MSLEVLITYEENRFLWSYNNKLIQIAKERNLDYLAKENLALHRIREKLNYLGLMPCLAYCFTLEVYLSKSMGLDLKLIRALYGNQVATEVLEGLSEDLVFNE